MGKSIPRLRAPFDAGAVSLRKVAGSLAAPAARVMFVDIARTVATLMMLQGHTLDALLASGARAGTTFAAWTFVRGLTSCMFLLLSGFAFSVASSHRWADHISSPAAIGRRLRRFGFFLVLGYALHAPAGEFADFATVGADSWRRFLAVDVLQCIAVMMCVLQLMIWLTRTPRRFALVTAASCAALVALTPTAWRVDWTEWLPSALAPYLSSASGSAFPLLPWGAYVLLGAFLGERYTRHGALDPGRFANRVLLGGGTALVAVSFIGTSIPLEPFGPTDFWYTSPNLFLLRTGLVLLVLGVIAHASRAVSKPGLIVQSLAHESLTVYTVHLCIVYGSVWSPGLAQLIGPTLPLSLALACVVTLLASMMLLAAGWYSCKRNRPALARQVRAGTLGVLFGKFL